MSPLNSVKSSKTYKEIYTRIKDRFNVLEDFTMASLKGDIRSIIVSGPPGLGKSFTVEKALKGWDPDRSKHIIIKGYITPVGLVRMLWEHRFDNHCIVFDDCDSMFWDETGINLLKTVCDTCETRTVSYVSDYKMVSKEDGDIIPERFEFNASVIFLTNMDFDFAIAKETKTSKHLEALVSRSHYIDLTLKSADDYLVRIDQVMDEGKMLSNLAKSEQDDVINFLYQNRGKLRELSLRMVIKLASIRKLKGKGAWETVAKVTCCK